MSAMSFDPPKPSHAAASFAPAVVRRRTGMVKVLITLSWMVGITGSFLAVGIIGMFASDLPPIHLKSLGEENEPELPMVETSMAELMSMEASAEQSAETEAVLPVEIPQTVETPPENLDLPEVAEAMTLEDVFSVPTAPKIEDALRPVDPVVKRTPQPPASSRTAPVASKGGTGGSTSQAGVAGGRGTSGSGGKGKFPQPPYPEFARSAGMQGTVRLKISFGPSGFVEGVSVISTSGFSSLDESTASFIRRNWSEPTGASHIRTVPITYRLR